MQKNEFPELTEELKESITNSISAKSGKQTSPFIFASIPAEAGTHEGHHRKWKPELERPDSIAPVRPLAQRGNPTLRIPPLVYAPHEHAGWIYIMANKPNGIIYIGQTTNLPKRVYEHKEGKIPGFSQKHGCTLLVYFEGFEKITESIDKETAMKEWPRRWKIRRILEANSEWRDLFAEICI